MSLTARSITRNVRRDVVQEKDKKRILEEAIKRADAEKQGLAVMFVDLDNFKSVNDTCGHEAEDDRDPLARHDRAARCDRGRRCPEVVARRWCSEGGSRW